MSFSWTSNPAAQLPQNASDSEKKVRLDALKRAQAVYEYAASKTIANIPFVEGTIKMKLERPRVAWILKVVWVLLAIFRNFAGYYALGALRRLLRRVTALFAGKLRFGQDRRDAAIIARHISDKVRSTKQNSKEINLDFEETSQTLDMYRQLFNTLPLPEIASNFMEDRIFARLRVAGYNPLSLFSVTHNNLPFRIPDSRMLRGDSIDRCIEERRLYAVDFSRLGAISQKKDTTKRFVITKALFCVPEKTPKSDLIPLAIEMDLNQIVYPPEGATCNARDEACPVRWSIAKLAVNVCDSLHHELIAHLARTHLVLEAFVIATMRQLAPTHPVYRLLRPHFEGTAFINEQALGTLVASGNEVDTIVAGDISDIHEFIENHLHDLQFNDSMPDIDLKTRGLLNNNLNMPYRDDALLHWNALLDWMAEYLAVFYKSNEDVTEDIELRMWARELVEKGGIKKFGDNGTGIITSLDYLVRAVAYVIFTASVQHAAVNFPQGTIMTYPPAVPGLLRGEVPHEKEKYVDLKTWEELLPSLENAVIQVEFLNILGGVYHTQLGKYRKNELPDMVPVRKGVERYQKKLIEIEKLIRKRENSSNSGLKYEYMLPSRVPQSINI